MNEINQYNHYLKFFCRWHRLNITSSSKWLHLLLPLENDDFWYDFKSHDFLYRSTFALFFFLSFLLSQSLLSVVVVFVSWCRSFSNILLLFKYIIEKYVNNNNHLPQSHRMRDYRWNRLYFWDLYWHYRPPSIISSNLHRLRLTWSLLNKWNYHIEIISLRPFKSLLHTKMGSLIFNPWWQGFKMKKTKFIHYFLELSNPLWMLLFWFYKFSSFFLILLVNRISRWGRASGIWLKYMYTVYIFILINFPSFVQYFSVRLLIFVKYSLAVFAIFLSFYVFADLTFCNM